MEIIENFVYCGVDYQLFFANSTIKDAFLSDIKKMKFPLISSEANSETIAVYFSPKAPSWNDVISVDHFHFKNKQCYRFRIKDFDIYLNTTTNVVYFVAESKCLESYACCMFIDLHLRLFYKRNSVMLHAGWVTKNDKHFILCGQSHSGKSTTCARLLHHGFNSVTDEVVLITPKGNSLYLFTPEPRLRVRRSAVKQFKELQLLELKNKNGELFVENNLVGDTFCANILKTNLFLGLLNKENEGLQAIQKIQGVPLQDIKIFEINRSSGEYLQREYDLILLRFYAMISGKTFIWNMPKDNLRFENSLHAILSLER